MLSSCPVRFSSATSLPMPWSMRSTIAAYTSMPAASHSLSATLSQSPACGAIALLRVDQPELRRLLEPGLADRLVPAVVLALVLRDVLRQGVHRPVGGGVGDVQEERLVRVVLGVVADEPDGVVGDRVGVVVRLRLVLRVGEGRDHGVVADQRRRVVEAAAAVDRAVEAVEPALERPVVLRPVRRRCAG